MHTIAPPHQRLLCPAEPPERGLLVYRHRIGHQSNTSRQRENIGTKRADEAWESVERDKLSGAGLRCDAVRCRLLPKPELNSSGGGGSEMGKA